VIHQLKIRKLLRESEDKFISERKISQTFKVNKKAALEILIHLENLGYIEKTAIDHLWQISIRGKILAHKKLSREFRVNTLQDHLNDFIKRLKIVNTSIEYPDYVSCAIITTEYPIVSRATGINIAYALESKGLSKKESKLIESELRKQHRGAFNNIVEFLYYPGEAINLFLKSRSPILKLRQYTKEEIKEISGHRILQRSRE